MAWFWVYATSILEYIYNLALNHPQRIDFAYTLMWTCLLKVMNGFADLLQVLLAINQIKINTPISVKMESHLQKTRLNYKNKIKLPIQEKRRRDIGNLVFYFSYSFAAVPSIYNLPELNVTQMSIKKL